MRQTRAGGFSRTRWGAAQATNAQRFLLRARTSTPLVCCRPRRSAALATTGTGFPNEPAISQMPSSHVLTAGVGGGQHVRQPLLLGRRRNTEDRMPVAPPLSRKRGPRSDPLGAQLCVAPAAITPTGVRPLTTLGG
ncbi:hypothetical protein GCM10022403_023630 [Streptomyces coacervatus]|uniref:Uncharacterized protein n=1 Tax=Streptomyces coacervatus TaxID=647381 RepID=A0ABP7HC09_9ACTN